MIYENVQRLCKERGVSVLKLETACGIGNGTIGKWRNRDSAPRVDTLQAIAAYFGVTVNDLLKEDA